ncbi:MAG: shikimate 5-dehydrogenase [Bacillales bacterium]|jgi:shikimate dehydrogenase|nr:shikimate 5-dehydrogenase [Bacillales bacterium]
MQKYFVIGDPIAQSKSPVMQNANFRDKGIEAELMATRIFEEELEFWVASFRKNGSGACVTIPHKVSIMQYLDEVDSFASEVGAVNTIVNQNGKLIGFNTDGPGFIQGLEEFDLSNRKILIIGAGGAARGIYYGFLHKGLSDITIANRTVVKGYAICPNVLTLEEAEERLSQFGLIVNTTPIGMFPDMEACPISLQNLTKETIVCDIIYNPFKTKFLKEAESRGAVIQNGLPMFVNQGALQFEYWTGQKADRKVMEEAVLEQLK